MMLWLGSRTKEETLDQVLWTGLLDGVVVSADPLEDPLVDGLLASELPTVLIGHRRGDRTASYVDVDNLQAADDRHHASPEARPQACGPHHGRRGTVAGEDRLTGYRRAMDRAGRTTDGLVVEGDFGKAAGAAGATDLLEQGRRRHLLRERRVCRRRARLDPRARARVPEDVALAGFDDVEFAAHLEPPLTTVRQRIQEQGVEAAHTLFELLRDPAGGPRRVILPTELVIRRSTIGRRGGDPGVAPDGTERGS